MPKETRSEQLRIPVIPEVRDRFRRCARAFGKSDPDTVEWLIDGFHQGTLSRLTLEQQAAYLRGKLSFAEVFGRERLPMLRSPGPTVVFGVDVTPTARQQIELYQRFFKVTFAVLVE